ncbi:hypothetical protein SAMN02745857_03177 [Andreprevotia lacus DSM 23236]|jgi:hypothetical protein|uniref:Lipoprotein n=1 Tax=Andreprevotia lacus DSM 23236 TaxID=1121001 RepID=A0A1W1XWK1_9NEIS|nr:hypothetical protein [Andreprevotia lacus]SMC28242.1 hypothetical protein SAMN02745857_03177 [Andreprevotia lacus DSM 23236]
MTILDSTLCRLGLCAAVATLFACSAETPDGGSVTPTPTPTVSPTPTPAPSTTAEGYWQGTMADGRAFRALVLDDSSFWITYSKKTDANVLAAVVAGAGSAASDNNFAGMVAREYNVESNTYTDAVLASAYYVPRIRFNGKLQYLSTSTISTFTSNFNVTYNTIPALSAIVGSYTGTGSLLASSDTSTVLIDTTGVVKGTLGTTGCTFTGKIAPHARGNLYDVSFTFAASSCKLSGSTVKGIAFVDPQTSRFNILTTDGGQNGYFFVSQS